MLKQNSKEELLQVDAKVIEVLPNANTKFKVRLISNNKIILAHVSGKIRINKIRVLLGDRVKVEISAYNFNEGRIVYRYT
ncbi:Translation initiation factor IF-1 [Candidatus Phytoplasma mali]|uniref:Translation initiation factor IF-1 n=1 Tax=Phytoplasma mali (strain AT) TaxID=482235 RepID=B3R013_PHYMT|nr:translation initiation factor IF-1 [Candidatus Phytoplasma mali]CAP18550.1 Translation initiation factor IF-1 [Candidatus Phytoplasma mali]